MNMKFYIWILCQLHIEYRIDPVIFFATEYFQYYEINYYVRLNAHSERLINYLRWQ